ncbi:MAG: hypothetical protein IIX61_01085 [Loktanella sp.]|nr:hypothetical protein [Loktanella sp.]
MTELRLRMEMKKVALSEKEQDAVLERLALANIGPDDPFASSYVSEAVVMKAAREMGQKIERFQAESTGHASALIKGLRVSTQDAMRKAADDVMRQSWRHAVIHLRAVLILAALALFGIGYAAGLQSGHDRQTSFMTAFAATPEAEAWERIIKLNGWLPIALAQECAPGGPQYSTDAMNGRPLCKIPFWTGEAPIQRNDGLFTRIGLEIRHHLNVMPFWLAILIGILAALTGQQLFRWAMTKNGDQDVKM